MQRSVVVYFKSADLHSAARRLNSKRMITPDAALGKVIGGKMTMFKMTKSAVAVLHKRNRANNITSCRRDGCLSVQHGSTRKILRPHCIFVADVIFRLACFAKHNRAGRSSST